MEYNPQSLLSWPYLYVLGGGPRVVVSTAAFHARVRGSVPGLGGLKKTKMFLPHPRVKVSIVGSLRDREVAYSASDRQGSSFEYCVWRTVSSQSSHHPQEVLLAQFSLYVHKGGLKPDSFHFIYTYYSLCHFSCIKSSFAMPFFLYHIFFLIFQGVICRRNHVVEARFLCYWHTHITIRGSWQCCLGPIHVLLSMPFLCVASPLGFLTQAGGS